MGLELRRQFGRRLRLGMVGGGLASLIGESHRMAARLDDRYELVAGCFSFDPGPNLTSPQTPERGESSRESRACLLGPGRTSIMIV